MSKFDTEYTSNVICPHCGYEDTDWFEGYDITDGSLDTHDCIDCGQPFILGVSITINFSTEKTTREEISLDKISDFKKMMKYITFDEIKIKNRYEEILEKMIKKHNETDWSNE